MADLQTIYYRIKLDSKGTQSEFMTVENAIKRLKDLVDDLSKTAPKNDPLLQSYARQLRDLNEIHRQNRIWFKDVEQIVSKLSEVSLKELQASLKQTQKEWRDLANSEMVDLKQLEELRRRESLLQEEIERRDLRRRAFAADFLKLNQLNNRQLAEGARQSKALLDTLPKGSKEMKQMLAYATGYANKLSEAKGGMSLGKAFDMGASGNKTQHTIADLNEGMKVLQGYVSEFGEYMDEGVLANYNRRIEQIRVRTQDAAKQIAETGNLPTGQRATIKQMEEAQRVLTDWQQSADVTIQKSVATWIANINRMVKEAKSAIASAADGSVADEARALLGRSKSGTPDTAEEARAAKTAAKEASEARINAAKAEEVHAEQLAKIERQRTEALEDAHAAHQQSIEDATLEEAAAKRVHDAHKDDIEAYNKLTEQKARAAKQEEDALARAKDHAEKEQQYKNQSSAKDAEILANRRAQRELEYTTAKGYQEGQAERARQEAELSRMQGELKSQQQAILDIDEEERRSIEAKNAALDRQANLRSRNAEIERQIKELEKPVEVSVKSDKVNAVALAAPDEALRQALERPSRSFKLNQFIANIGGTLREGLGPVGDDVAEQFVSTFLGKVRGELNKGIPFTAQSARTSLNAALEGTLKRMNITGDQATAVQAKLSAVSQDTMRELIDVARSSTSGITYIMRELRHLTKEEMDDLQNWDELSKSTDKKVQQRLENLTKRIRELTNTGVQRLATDTGLKNSPGSKAIADEIAGGVYDASIRGIAGRMGDDKGLRTIINEKVVKEMKSAFGKSDEEKEMADEFFGKFRSAVVRSLEQKIPDMTSDMRPMMEGMMANIINSMNLPKEKMEALFKAFRDNVKESALNAIRTSSMEMRRNTMGGIDLDGMYSEDAWWSDLEYKQYPIKSGATGFPPREERDRGPRVESFTQAKYKVGEMLTGTSSRGGGGFQSHLTEASTTMSSFVGDLRTADSILAKMENNLRDQTPQSLKQVRKAISDMMQATVVDMQNMISNNGGMLSESVYQTLVQNMTRFQNLMDEVKNLNRGKNEGGALRESNNLKAGIKEMQNRFVNGVMDDGTVGKSMASLMRSDTFVDEFMAAIKKAAPQTQEELMNVFKTFINETSKTAVEAGKISKEAVDATVFYAEKMMGEKSFSKVFQQYINPDKTYFDASTIEKTTSKIVGSLQQHLKGMQETLAGTDSINPFRTLVEKLGNKENTDQLVQGWNKIIREAQTEMLKPENADNMDYRAVVASLTQVVNISDDLKRKIAAAPDKDIYTIMREHVEELLAAHDEEKRKLAEEAQAFEAARRADEEDMGAGMMSDDTAEMQEQYLKHKQAFDATSQLYKQMAKSVEYMTQHEGELQRAEEAAAEQTKQNAEAIKQLRAESVANTAQMDVEEQAAKDAADATQGLADRRAAAAAAVEKTASAVAEQAKVVNEITTSLNNAENQSAFALETANVKRLNDEKTSLENNLKKLNTDRETAEKALARIQELKGKESVTAEESGLIAQEASFQKILSEYDTKRLANRKEAERIEKEIANHRVLQTAAGKGDDEWAAAMSKQLETLEAGIVSLEKEKSRLMHTPKSETRDQEIADLATAIDAQKKQLADGKKALEDYSTSSERTAKAVADLKEKEAALTAEQKVANQNAENEARLARIENANASQAAKRKDDLQSSIDDMQELNRVAIDAQRNYQAAKQKLSDLRATNPDEQANADYQARLAAADKELAEAKEAARVATEAEQAAMDNYTAALSKNGGVSIAHLKQMRDNVKYLKDNVEDNEAIQRYGELVAELDKRIAELDAAPLRKASDVIADADDLLSRPTSRPDTRAELEANEQAKLREAQTQEAMQLAEQEHGVRMQQLDQEWEAEKRNRREHEEARKFNEDKVSAARQAVEKADQQSFIDEQTSLKAQQEARAATLELQKQEIEQRKQKNDLDRQNAGYQKDAEQAQRGINDIQDEVYQAQKRRNSEAFEAQTDVNRAEKEHTRLLVEQMAHKRRLKEMADAEIADLQKRLAIEQDEAKRRSLQSQISDMQKTGLPKSVAAASLQSDDALWRTGARKISDAQAEILKREESRQEIHAEREKLAGTNLLINEKNNREALDSWKSFVNEYYKVITDNKERMMNMGVDAEHLFMSDTFLNQLRGKWQKIFESVRYNTDAAFRANMNEMMRQDLETMRDLAHNVSSAMKQELTQGQVEQLATVSRDTLQQNLHIWGKIVPDETASMGMGVYAKFGEVAEAVADKVEKGHKKGKKAVDEQKQAVVELTDEQKQLVDTYLDNQKKAKDEMARVQALADYKTITDEGKAAKRTKPDERTEEQKAAVARQEEMWAEKNRLDSANREIYKQLKELGFDLNTQQAEYLTQKREELGLAKKIKDEKASSAPAAGGDSAGSAADQQKADRAQQRADKQKQENERKQRELDQRESKLDEKISTQQSIIDRVRAARDYNKSASRINEIDAEMAEIEKTIANAPKAAQAYQELAMAKQKVSEAEARDKKDKTDDSARALAEAKAIQQQKMEALVAAHATDEQKARLVELNQAKQAAIDADKKFADEDARIVAEQQSVDQQMQETTTAINGYTTAITRAQEAMQNLDKAKQDFDKAQQDLAAWDASHPYNASLLDDEYAARKQQLEATLALAKQNHEAAVQQVADTQAALNAAEAKGSASIQQLREAYAEAQKSFATSTDQGERDALNQRMANIQALINKLDVKPMRDLNTILHDVSGAQSVQQMDALKQELEQVFRHLTNDAQRADAKNAIEALTDKLRDMGKTMMNENDVMQEYYNSLALIKKGEAANADEIQRQIAINQRALQSREIDVALRNQVAASIREMEALLKGQNATIMTSQEGEEAYARALELVALGTDAKAEEVRKYIDLMGQARLVDNLSIEKERERAQVQKQLQDMLNATGKDYMSLDKAEEVYRKGLAATSDELKKAIEGIEHSINTDDHSQQHLVELTNMVDALKQRLKGEGYDKSWLDGILGPKNQNITNAKLQDLQRALQMVRNEMQVTGERTGNNSKKFAELQNRATLLELEIKRVSGSIEGMNDELKNQSDWFTTNMKKLANYLGVFGSFYMVREQFQKFFQSSMKYDDQLTDIRKTTDLTEASVRLLADGIKHIDSRSSVEALQALAYSAGKLGVKGVSDVMGFVRSADMLKVSLGEQLGDDAAEKLMKIANIMGTTEAYGLAEAMERTGSAITYLAKNSAASGDAILAFMSRTAGLSRQAGISTAQLSGLAAAVSALNQPAEMSATSFSKMMVQMEKSYKTVGAALKMTDREMETMRLNLETGNGMEAFLDMLRRVKELGGLSQTSAIAKDLGSEGNRVIQTLSTLSSNYETITKMVNQSTQAFEENITVQEEYKKKNENTAALYERLKNNFAKLFVSPEANDWLRDVLKQLQGLPDAVKELVGNFKWLAELIGGFVVKHVNGLVNALSALFYVMAGRAVLVNFGNGLQHINRAMMTLRNTTTRNAIPAIQRLNAQILSTNSVIGRASLQLQKFFTILRVSSLGNIFTAIITVGTVIYELFLNNKKAVTDWGESVQTALKRVDAAADETSDKMQDMLTALDNQNLSEAENLRLRHELQDMYKDYLGNLDLEKAGYEELKTSIEAANGALRAKQILEATQANIDEKRRKGAEEQAPEYGKMVDLVLSRLPEARVETRDEQGNVVEAAYSETMRRADAMRIVTQIMKEPDKYLPKNNNGEYDVDKVYLAWLSESEQRIQDAINSVLIPGSRLIDQQKYATTTNEARIAESVRRNLDVDWMDEMQDAMKSLFNNQASLKKSIEYAEEFGNAQASIYSEAWMKVAKPRMEEQWALIEDQIQRKGKTTGNGEFDAEGKRINRTDKTSNDGTSDDWARDKREMENDFRNEQIQAAKYWLADARQYIEFLRANNNGQDDTDEIKKLQNKIDNVDAYREVLEHKISDISEDETETKKASKAKQELDNIIAKIKRFYELQSVEYEKMHNAELLTDVQYQRALEENEMELNKTLSMARKTIAGDMDEATFWAQRVQEIASQNIAGVEGLVAWQRIYNTDHDKNGRMNNGLREKIGKPLDSADKEDGTMIINDIRLEASKNDNAVQKTIRERAKRVLNAWFETNVLGKLSNDSFEKFEELDMMLVKYTNGMISHVTYVLDEATGKIQEKVENIQMSQDEMKQMAMETYREVGKNLHLFDAFDEDETSDRSIYAFQKYLQKFPQLAELASQKTAQQLQGIYYKIFEYNEQYTEQITTLINKQQKNWDKMLNVSKESIDSVLSQFNSERVEKMRSFMMKFGMSGRPALQEDLMKKQAAYAKATADWQMKQVIAQRQLQAALASANKDEIELAEAQVEALKKPTEEVISSLKAVDDAMIKLQEDTWGWLGGIESSFEQFGNDVFKLRSWYEEKGDFWTNTFGTKAERQEAFASFMDDLKRALRAAAIEQSRAALTSWFLKKFAPKKEDKPEDKKQQLPEPDNKQHSELLNSRLDTEQAFYDASVQQVESYGQRLNNVFTKIYQQTFGPKSFMEHVSQEMRESTKFWATGKSPEQLAAEQTLDKYRTIDMTGKMNVGQSNGKDSVNRQEMIVLHHTGADASGLATAKYFASNAKEVGAHLVIDRDGTRYEMATPDKVAWHAGKSYWKGEDNVNNRAYGVEIAGGVKGTATEHLTQDQIDSVVEAILPIIKENGISLENVVSHSFITSRKYDVVNEELDRIKQQLFDVYYKDIYNQALADIAEYESQLQSESNPERRAALQRSLDEARKRAEVNKLTKADDDLKRYRAEEAEWKKKKDEEARAAGFSSREDSTFVASYRAEYEKRGVSETALANNGKSSATPSYTPWNPSVPSYELSDEDRALYASLHSDANKHVEASEQQAEASEKVADAVQQVASPRGLGLVTTDKENGETRVADGSYPFAPMELLSDEDRDLFNRLASSAERIAEVVTEDSTTEGDGGPRGLGLVTTDKENPSSLGGDSYWGQDIVSGEVKSVFSTLTKEAIEGELDEQKAATAIMNGIYQSSMTELERITDKGVKKIFSIKQKEAQKERKLDKDTAAERTSVEEDVTAEIIDNVVSAGMARKKVSTEVKNVEIANNTEATSQTVANKTSETTVSMWGSFGEAIAKAWADGGPYLGPILAAVVSAALGSVMTMVFNMMGGSKKTASVPKTKLVSGMLTYDRGNVQMFAARTYDRGGASSGGHSINMLPVMGDDGRVYFVPEGDLQGHNGMSNYTGMVTRPTLTTVGGAPALVGERGPEMVIGRETTQAMQMSRPDLLKQIIEFDRNRSRGFAKTFDSGNIAAQSVVSTDSPDALAELLAANQQMMAELASVNGQLADQLSRGIKASIAKYGPNGLIEETAAGLAEARRMGNNKNVQRLFGR